MHAHTHPRMNTHACARTRADTPAHACIRTHTRYARTHGRKHMHACTLMHAYARARTNTPSHVHALVQTHAHIFWLRYNRLGPYSLDVSCVYEDLVSFWLFGLVCIAITWSRLRRQRWWLRLSGPAGQCQWEWCSISRPPAGRCMPCINLLPLPPSCCSHWPVGGFQQCRVCFLSCCSCLAWRLLCLAFAVPCCGFVTSLCPGPLVTRF